MTTTATHADLPDESSYRWPRRAYLAGSVGFITIGLLHTITHVAELSSAELESRFELVGTIRVSAQDVSPWDLFQGTSLLMGLFSIAVGCAAMVALRTAGPTSRPPVGICITNLATLIGIAGVGIAHLGPLQLWGGLLGVAMFTYAALAPGPRDPVIGV